MSIVGAYNQTVLPIQYLRAIAALMVVAYHAPATLPVFEHSLPILKVGMYGVDIFFVISGFIMALSTWQKPSTRIEFIEKRLLRIVPLYWFITLFMVLLALAAPSLFRSLIINPVTLLKSLFFVPHYSLSFPDAIWPILIPGWTLNYEMFFYAIFTVLIPFSIRIRVFGVTAVLVALVLSGVMYSSNNAIYLFYTDSILLEFVFGMWIAFLYCRERLMNFWLSCALVVAGIALFSVGGFLLRGLVIGVGAAMIVLGGLVILRPLKSRAMEILGDASYSIYLTQYFGFGALRILWTRLGIQGDDTPFAVLYVLAAIAVCTGLGILVHAHIEKPVTKYLKHRISHIRSRRRRPLSV